MADITGLNPSQAKTQIGIFYDQGVALTRDFENVEEVFMYNLHDEWYSPKASEFGTKYSLELFNVGNSVRMSLFKICQNARDAYNSLATSNGAPTIADDYFSEGSLYQPQMANEAFSIKLNEIGPSGEIGMKVEDVKITVNTLKEGIDKLIAGLEALPIDIAFYDPNGEMKLAYKQEILNVVQKISELATNIYADIDSAIETETHLIEEAKNAAADTMNV